MRFKQETPIGCILLGLYMFDGMPDIAKIQEEKKLLMLVSPKYQMAGLYHTVHQ